MNNELRALLIQALQEETCGVPAQPATDSIGPTNTATDSTGSGTNIELSPTPETTQASINYWPLVALAAFSYLFLSDGK
ncbi:MAG: hypothetical protein Q8L07_04250 [Sediminibacterium sp.]|nr:hypothetical protein [Sediminibacterium sp.]